MQTELVCLMHCIYTTRLHTIYWTSIVKHKHCTMYAKWKSFPLTVSCLKIKFRLKAKLNYVLFINVIALRFEHLKFKKSRKRRKCKVYSIVWFTPVHSLKVHNLKIWLID